MAVYRVAIKEVWERTVLVEAEDMDHAIVKAHYACDIQKFDGIKQLTMYLLWAEGIDEIDLSKASEIPVFPAADK